MIKYEVNLKLSFVASILSFDMKPFNMFLFKILMSASFIGLTKCQSLTIGNPTYSHCEDITIPMCLDMPYTKTVYPNLMGHANQDEASDAIYQYFPLIKVNCSADIKVMFALTRTFCIFFSTNKFQSKYIQKNIWYEPDIFKGVLFN